MELYTIAVRKWHGEGGDGICIPTKQKDGHNDQQESSLHGTQFPSCTIQYFYVIGRL